ncbi:MAG: hypothetical protein Ct9H300mP6_13770 [Gammaproteobacteria bacterium]|nr:MAG: hypothetical protein Ct9H300mP6_13770 [Gammaproteobacteria bacterium]
MEYHNFLLKNLYSSETSEIKEVGGIMALICIKNHPLCLDTSLEINDLLSKDKKVLFEGLKAVCLILIMELPLSLHFSNTVAGAASTGVESGQVCLIRSLALPKLTPLEWAQDLSQQS